ncbi:hypothetical protein [Thalassospira indica]|uniref:Transcriptional regulator n=1 Tax=Thalassospira indica TaxID=1891279 RepID=A0ABN5NB53_9PROT|nr:hypothetical protein [Thalassospira indica]AXO13660.1 hypothetical protein DY252_05065 [Thalassospira indica]OAZ14458.1 hypothetical protein TH15_01165 [Thalassospira profundimaris]
MAKATNDPDQSQTTGASSSDADDERLDQLARQFLELWRQQVAATADGAHAASAIGRLYASLGADTTRMGEGFEAWGKLIGQMAMGQHPAAGPGNPINNPMGDAMAAANPLQAMMDQMAKAARELPASPFAGMPFAPDMSAMAGMAGMTPKPDTAKAEPDAAGNAAGDADGQTSDKDSAQTSAADEANKTSKTKRAAKNAAKGQGKNDQSAKTKAASAKTRKSEAGGAKTASDASGSRDDELAQLARRIADLSETIAALEAGTEGSGGKSSG